MKNKQSEIKKIYTSFFAAMPFWSCSFQDSTVWQLITCPSSAILIMITSWISSLFWFLYICFCVRWRNSCNLGSLYIASSTPNVQFDICIGNTYFLVMKGESSRNTWRVLICQLCFLCVNIIDKNTLSFQVKKVGAAQMTHGFWILVMKEGT